MNQGIGALIGLIVNLLPFLILLGLGLFVGRHREKSHFRNLARREAETADMLITEIRSFPGGVSRRLPPAMMVAEVTIATDYLKNFLSGLRNIFGGEMKSYQTLMVRARREALLRIVEQARTAGYDAICNVRLETADIGGATTRKKVAMCSIVASGTAYCRESA